MIEGFEDILEQRRAEKAEALRFAKAGLGVHDSELVYAEDAEALMVRIAGPNWREVQAAYRAEKDKAAREWRESQREAV